MSLIGGSFVWKFEEKIDIKWIVIKMMEEYNNDNIVLVEDVIIMI